MALIALLPNYAEAEAEIPEFDGRFGSVTERRAWTSPTRVGSGGVLALTFVDADRTKLVVVTEGPKGKSGSRDRRLSFYVKEGTRFVETYRLITPNAFLSMYPLEEGDRLVTMWATGSGFRTGVFVFGSDRVEVALWLGSQRPPEFVDLDGDGEEEIVQARLIYPGSKTPELADIYVWDGKRYRLVRSVPWDDRYRVP